MKKTRIKALTETALFVAIISVISQISIPIGALFVTLQVFAASVTGYFLGVKKGVVAITVYILLGCIGAPVFAGFRGGFYIICSYTGGFILGFIPLVVLCGIYSTKRVGILLGAIGTVICHLMGIIQYSLISQIGMLNSFLVVSLPYILKDILLVILAYFINTRIKKALQA